MYDQGAIRELFEKWGHEEIEGDPGETTSRWSVPHISHTILDRWLPSEGTALDAGCGGGPTVGLYGYVGAPDDTLRRGLALEERFLGIPELVGAGGELIAVCEKTK